MNIKHILPISILALTALGNVAEATVVQPTRYQVYTANIQTSSTSTTSNFTSPVGSGGGGGNPGICAVDQILGGFGAVGDEIWVDINPSGFWRLNASIGSYSGRPSAEMVCAPLSNFSNIGTLVTSNVSGSSNGFDVISAGVYNNQGVRITDNADGQLNPLALNLFEGAGGFLGNDQTRFNGSFVFSAQLKTNSNSSLNLGGVNITNAEHAVNQYPQDGSQIAQLRAITDVHDYSIAKQNGTAWTYTTRDVLVANDASGSNTRASLASDLSQNFCYLTGVGADFTDSTHAVKIVPTPGTAGASVQAFGVGTKGTASCIPYSQTNQQ